MKNFFISPLPQAMVWVLILAFLGGAAFGAKEYLGLYRQSLVLARTLAEKEKTLAETAQKLAQVENEAADLSGRLDAEVARNNEFSDQIGEINDTVSQLEKLKKIDPELLKKYSKVYFLNENYRPADLSEIDEKYWFDQKKPQEVLTKIRTKLHRMLAAAAKDDITLQVVSGYRSFETQATLKSQYQVIYGSGANQFSSDQGYSEHQLGTTVDITTPGVVSTTAAFEQTPAYEWLTKNAYRYGFILSYPKQNAYYQFEPWHWRYVGEDLAADLHRDQAYFYDWDQRTIDKYLIKFFD